MLFLKPAKEIFFFLTHVYHGKFGLFFDLLLINKNRKKLEKNFHIVVFDKNITCFW